MTEPADDTYLLHLVTALRRRWLIVLVCALATPAVALAVSQNKPKEYSAEAEILFGSTHFDQALFGSSATPAPDPTRQAATNLRLVDLGAVCARTGRALGVPAQKVCNAITVAAEGDSDLASVTATWGRPRFAARLADAYVRQYIAFRRKAQQGQLREAQRVVELQLAQTPEGTTSTDGQSLQERANQLRILAALQTGDAELVSPAGVPGAPSSPRPKRDAVLGLVLGLVLGCGLALLADRLDRRLRSADEVRRALRAPVLGAVPLNRRLKVGGPLDPRTGDAFRALHANLHYVDSERDLHSVMFTSLGSSDGRSVVAWHVAAVVADSGSRVLLVRADLRAPSPGPGLTTVLVDGAALDEVVHPVEDVDGTLDVLEPGPDAGTPMSVLATPRMVALLEQARQRYDLVVVDAPPLGTVPDGIPLARSADGVLVVVHTGRHSGRALRALRAELDHLNVGVVGAVLTGTRPSAERYGSIDLSPSLDAS
jgi:capsular exopolysaccharide synthesis family protein